MQRSSAIGTNFISKIPHSPGEILVRAEIYRFAMRMLEKTPASTSNCIIGAFQDAATQNPKPHTSPFGNLDPHGNQRAPVRRAIGDCDTCLEMLPKLCGPRCPRARLEIVRKELRLARRVCVCVSMRIYEEMHTYTCLHLFIYSVDDVGSHFGGLGVHLNLLHDVVVPGQVL